ncbi:MAG TPA: DUF951 domain-containing protein [Chthonomonadales bacterium]|nr:DUF951 domain-containing protein [Chthonomonadales bacterium]
MDPLLGHAPLRPGDVVVLRKPHPCGGHEWTVTRTGADIGLRCGRCGRHVMLDREECERRLRRRIVVGGQPGEPPR